MQNPYKCPGKDAFMQTKEFYWKERVHIYDTDSQGIVHYAGYYRFFTDASEQYAKSRFGLNWPLVNDKVWFVVVDSYARYRMPLRLGDEIRTYVNAATAGSKAIEFAFKIYRNTDMVCEGRIVQVAIDKKAWKAVSLPRSIAARISGRTVKR